MADHIIIQCDAIKVAYRQSKDGFVVSFAIHPQDMPADLANADIGSQWCLKLSALDEDGNSPQESSAAHRGATNAAEPAPVVVPPERPRATEQEVMQHSKSAPVDDPKHKTRPDRASAKPPGRATISLAQRAGMLCREPLFWQFIQERLLSERHVRCNVGDDAAEALRCYCGVVSRSDIRPGTPAAAKFEALAYDYAGWKAEASAVPA